MALLPKRVSALHTGKAGAVVTTVAGACRATQIDYRPEVHLILRGARTAVETALSALGQPLPLLVPPRPPLPIIGLIMLLTVPV